MRLIADELYAEDYEHLDGLWDDIKSKLLKPVWQAIQPSVPEITYRVLVPGAEPVPVTTQPTQQIVIQKPVIPSWLIPVGIAVVGGLVLLPKLLRK